jgi:chromosome segregation ATPase
VDEFELNMENLEEEMERLEFEMDDLSKEMEELDREMKILDKFLKAIKKELVKDNYLNNADENFELELSSTEMKVNNKKVPDDLFNKYKEIYKEHYNKEPGDKIKIHIN